MSIFVYFPIYKWESPLIWRIILTKNFNILISRGFEIVTKTSNLKKNWISFLFFFFFEFFAEFFFRNFVKLNGYQRCLARI